MTQIYIVKIIFKPQTNVPLYFIQHCSSKTKRMVRFKKNHFAYSEFEFWIEPPKWKKNWFLNDYSSVYIRLSRSFHKIEHAMLLWIPFKFPKCKFIVLLKPFVLYLNGLELPTLCFRSIYIFFSSSVISHQHEINLSGRFE